MMTDQQILEAYEASYKRLPTVYRRKLLAILERETEEGRNSGLTLLALRAFPSSPTQKMLQSLRRWPKQ